MDALQKLQSALAGRYNVVREIGEGGMATVYLARDVKHDRHVALKLLRPELGAVLGVERFLSEIKVTAHLQHPHLLPLFDSGEADGLLFYVMPYVEGESLRKRLDREHQLPVDEALRIAVAVASALDYAHKQGVVHRDLKPENILLQHGEPVVSDFGIALAVSKAGGARVTQTGLSLGTPQYMSPEQATGDRDVDARSDIYSLAAVLYEMLTGEPPHQGKTAQAIIARVLTEKPSSARVMRDTVPEHVDATLLKALSKLPADRFATAGEFAAALKSPGAATTAVTGAGLTGPRAADDARGATVGPARRWRSRVTRGAPWLLATALAGVVVVQRATMPVAPDAPVVRMPVSIPVSLGAGVINSPLAVSPDGATILVGSLLQNTGGLAVRTLADTALRRLPGTAGARFAFFAPDGSRVGFFANGRLYTVPLSGGTPTVICEVPAGSPRGSWSSQGMIAFSRGDGSGIWIVPSSGGSPRQLVAPDTTRGEVDARAPSFLPDGRSVLYASLRAGGAGLNAAYIAAATLDGDIRVFGEHGVRPQYVDPGFIVFDDLAGNVKVLRYDPSSRTIAGQAVTILTGMATTGSGTGAWAVSLNGTLVQFIGSATSILARVTRAGVVTALMDRPRRFRRPRASPLGDRIVVEIDPRGADGEVGDEVNLWVYSAAARNLSRLTFGRGGQDPMWFRDGKRVAFAVPDSGGGFDIYAQAADGSSAAVPVLVAPGSQWPYGTTPDGRTLLIDESIRGLPVHLATVDLSAEPRVARQLFDASYTNRLGELSADGKWLAYTSTESGTTEVYVRPFPSGDGKWLISAGGGDQALWHPNGRELFYRAAGKIMSATVRTTPTFEVLERTVLFDDVFDVAGTLNWDVMPSGNEFVMLKPEGAQTQLLVTVNWSAELRRAMAAVRVP